MNQKADIVWIRKYLRLLSESWRWITGIQRLLWSTSLRQSCSIVSFFVMCIGTFLSLSVAIKASLLPPESSWNSICILFGGLSARVRAMLEVSTLSRKWLCGGGCVSVCGGHEWGYESQNRHRESVALYSRGRAMRRMSILQNISGIFLLIVEEK